MNKDIHTRLTQAWAEHFGDNDGCRFFFSPSRINIIGEHIDYNGGCVFPCAITIGTYAMARKNGLKQIRLYSANLNSFGIVELPVGEYCEEREWLNYPAGVMRYLERRGYRIEGFDIVIYGNIPNGSGLSSSASLELLTGTVVGEVFCDGEIPVIERVRAGVWCENAYFGLHTGIMDQYVIGFGKPGQAMLLDTHLETHTYFPFSIPGASVVILNTNKRRELKDSKYNERRSQCEEALGILQSYRPDLKNLCQISEEDMSLLNRLRNPILYRRARHVVTENGRVRRAITAIRRGDCEALGGILRESHQSLREDYEVTGLHLDAITDAANRAEGCLGARMTGAGFGGCGIALVRRDAVSDFCSEVSDRYQKTTGLEAQLIEAMADGGAREIFI